MTHTVRWLDASFYGAPKARLDTACARALLRSNLQGLGCFAARHLQLPAALWQLPGCFWHLPRACSQGELGLSAVLRPATFRPPGARVFCCGKTELLTCSCGFWSTPAPTWQLPAFGVHLGLATSDTESARALLRSNLPGHGVSLRRDRGFGVVLASFLSAGCEFQLLGGNLNESTATAHLLRLQKWGSAAPGR